MGRSNGQSRDHHVTRLKSFRRGRPALPDRGIKCGAVCRRTDLASVGLGDGGRQVREGIEQPSEDDQLHDLRWRREAGLDGRAGPDGQGVRCRGLEGRAYDEVPGTDHELGCFGEFTSLSRFRPMGCILTD